MVAWFLIERDDDETYRITDGWCYIGYSGLTRLKEEAIVYYTYGQALENGTVILNDHPEYGKLGV